MRPFGGARQRASSLRTSARCACSASAAAIAAPGAPLFSGWYAREDRQSGICLFPRARGRILTDAPARALARALARYCASAFAPSERGRVSVLGWHIREDRTQGISMFFRGVEGAAPYRCLRGEIKKNNNRAFLWFLLRDIIDCRRSLAQDAIKREERGRF